MVTEVRVNRRAADRVRLGHPWIFRSDLYHNGGAVAGQVVRVLDGRNNRVGAAHYSSTSQITLRMLPWDVAITDVGFFRRLIKRAQAHRERVVRDTDAYRVVHGEADLLPALVIDRYGDHFVIQTLSQGMDAAKAAIVSALAEIFSPKAIIERNDVSVREKEGLAEVRGILFGQAPDPGEITINGLRFGVDLLEGQKTGMFLDQRENYRAARHWARGSALDAFTYHGGFALHLAQQCERVEGIDSSGPAIEHATANAQRNGLVNVSFRQADVFEMLQQHAHSQRHFDTVILDPPAFAKSSRHRENAARAYKDVNLRALRLLQRDGVLITCSCSHHFSEADLLEATAAAAVDAGRTLRVLERRSQALDHPVLLTVPETHYLKCLVLQVV